MLDRIEREWRIFSDEVDKNKKECDIIFKNIKRLYEEKKFNNIKYINRENIIVTNFDGIEIEFKNISIHKTMENFLEWKIGKLIFSEQNNDNIKLLDYISNN